MYSSCSFLLVLVQARQRGPQQRLQRMPGLHPPPTPPRQGKGGNQSWHLTCQIPQGILFLTSLFSSKSWQGLVLFEILCPQWFLYSSRLPRHEFKREVAPSPALHCSCSFNSWQYKSRIQGACLHLPAPCICMELDMEMELLPFMRDAVVLTLCSVLSFVPSPQWHVASLCLVHCQKLALAPTSRIFVSVLFISTLGWQWFSELEKIHSSSWLRWVYFSFPVQCNFLDTAIYIYNSLHACLLCLFFFMVVSSFQ